MAAWVVPTADLASAGVLAAIIVALVATAVPLLRVSWQPVTGLIALLLGWRLRPGDRAWRIS